MKSGQYGRQLSTLVIIKVKTHTWYIKKHSTYAINVICSKCNISLAIYCITSFTSAAL